MFFVHQGESPGLLVMPGEIGFIFDILFKRSTLLRQQDSPQCVCTRYDYLMQA